MRSYIPYTMPVTVKLPRCTECGSSMYLSRIEPAKKEAHDLRTYECPICQHTEDQEVKFR